MFDRLFLDTSDLPFIPPICWHKNRKFSRLQAVIIDAMVRFSWGLVTGSCIHLTFLQINVHLDTLLLDVCLCHPDLGSTKSLVSVDWLHHLCTVSQTFIPNWVSLVGQAFVLAVTHDWFILVMLVSCVFHGGCRWTTPWLNHYVIECRAATYSMHIKN